MFGFSDRGWSGIVLAAALLACAACEPGEQDGDGAVDDAGRDAAPDAGDAASADADADDADQDDADLPDAGDAAAPASACDPATLEGRLATGAWDPRFTMPGVTGFDGYVPSVHAFALDADGSLLTAGYFRWAGTETVGPLARIRDGMWTRARADLPSDSFSAVATSARGLALATFQPLLPDPSAPAQRGRIFVDSGQGLRAVGSFEGIVRALAWVSDALWVGGHFTLEEGLAELAVWREGAGWSAPPGGAVDGPVYALLAEPQEIVVGGSFSQVGGVAARSVAAFDGTSWHARSLSGFAPEPSSVFSGGPIVFGLTRDGQGALVAGGAFYPEGASSGGVARWNGSSWEPLGAGLTAYGGLAGDTPAIVADVAFFEGQIYAAGCVDGTADGAELPGVARFDGTRWEAPPGSEPGTYVSSPWYPGFDVCGAEPSGTAILEARRQRLVAHGGRLYVGGSFAGIGGVASQSIIAHDGESWLPVGSTSGLGVAGNASELAVGGPACSVYQLAMPANGGAEPGSVYQLGADAWTALPGQRPQDVLCSQLAVSAAGDVYLGCETPWSDDPPAPALPRVYRHDGTSFVSLGDIPGVESGVVHDMLFDPAGRLWIVGGAEQGFIARWDGQSMTTVERELDGFVSKIAFAPGDGDRFVIGGGFTRIGTSAARSVAHWNGARWEALGPGFATPPAALAITPDAIYASTTPGDPSAGDVQWTLGRWDGARWQELGVPERGLPRHIGHARGIKHQLNAIWANGAHLVVAGDIFPEAASATSGARNVYVYDGERFAPLAGGIGAIAVDAMVLTPDAIVFGGFIATTGGGEQLAPSVGIARFRLATP